MKPDSVVVSVALSQPVPDHHHHQKQFVVAVHCIVSIGLQKSPADARVTRDSAVIPRWLSAAILDIIEPEIAPFDPPTPKALA